MLIFMSFLAICEIQLENTLMEVQRLEEMVLTTPASTTMTPVA
jgi:hypothetical protein